MPAKAKKHAQRADDPKPLNIPFSERPTLNIDEFCQMVGIGRSSCYKAIDAGDLVPRYYGRRVFITKEEMARFVKNMSLRQRPSEAGAST